MTYTITGFERTFSLSVPVERAWRAFTDPEELEVWFTDKFTADTAGDEQTAVAESPGGRVGFAVTEFVENKRLGYRQWAADPATGIDVTVVFEEVDGGTKITMTQAGFGTGSILSSDQVRRGMDETLADLVLYLEHGVRFARHRDVTARSSLGAWFVEVPGAVAVDEVTPHSFADRAGLQVGDLLLQLGHSSVFDISDVAFFLREHAEGDEVAVVYARDGALHRAAGRLAPKDEPRFLTVP
jgi:uncharacterized protein YndB with AHSA1/START domain